jgi:hypothetical protein
MFLIEVMVYMVLFLMVTMLAYSVFERGWNNSLNLRRGAEQLSRTLTIGERWRSDLRGATGPLRAETLPAEQILHIPHGGGETQYRFADGAIWRRSDERGDWAQLLDRVKASHMQPDVRGEVTAWRWEVELKTREKNVRMPPVLTFLAVPGRQTPAQ